MLYSQALFSALLYCSIIQSGNAIWAPEMAIVDLLFLRHTDFNQTIDADRHNSSARDVWDPKITNPKSSTVWVFGTTAKATWDTSDKPQHVTNPKGKLVLGYVEDDDDDEHLNMDQPLADDFDLSKGWVAFEVPEVDSRNDYIVVLFGDSGNRSPTFTIN